ncbi:MAG: TIGR00300 family protein [Candidatus Freyarchaeota archaeon]|nr:TIGR00300 family protein [Candidatus Jordarchaeia archaeon]MBS7279461.1 TIGR00300 family protein [Candidatus Jordarchaeia archaeon]
MIEAEIELTGHIIDSMILPKIFGAIYDLNGEFEVLEFRIGKTKDEYSHAYIRIFGKDRQHLDMILAELQKLGAVVTEKAVDAELIPAPGDGVLPDNFYSTTNHPTFIMINGEWIKTENQEMDKVIVIREGKPQSIPMRKVKKGELVVVGNKGIKVIPPERSRKKEVFSFMSSAISSEKPTLSLTRMIAKEMFELRKKGGKIVVVPGPAVIHAGASAALSELIRMGYVQALLTGNALAVHDVENFLYGTSLGMDLKTLENYEGGHRHHLMAINVIRKAGSIRDAVEKGILKSGIMYECIRNNVELVLAGSIRDDGPIPDVITDVMEAQDAMRKALKNTDLVLMLATTLHSIAVGNMLPSTVKTICIDINPAVVTKLTDRGTYAIGIISDVGAFLPRLVQELWQLEGTV